MFCRIEESKCNPAILSQWVHETADWPPWFYIPRPSRAPIAMGFRDCDGIAVGFRIVAGLVLDLVLLVWAGRRVLSFLWWGCWLAGRIKRSLTVAVPLCD